MFVSSASKELFRPSFPRFLIALFLVKSKPAGLSVPGRHLDLCVMCIVLWSIPEDYIQALQDCVTQGRRPDTSADARHHVDISALWHEKYKKSEESQLELRAKISELESLQASTKAEIASKKIQQRKRKRCMNDPKHTLDHNTQKRSRAQALDPASQSDAGPVRLFAVEPGRSPLNYGGENQTLCPRSYEVKSTGSNLPQHFYFLQKLASMRPPCGHNLAIALSHISSDIRLIISSVTSSRHTNIVAVRNVTTRAQERNECNAQANMGQELEIVLTAIGHMFPRLLNALDQLTEGAQGPLTHPRIVHGIVRLLQDLFERILTLAAESSQSSPPVKASTRDESKVKTLPHLDINIMKLCQLTLTLVAGLDSHRAADQEILDGFLFFLLSRVGVILRLFVFGPDSNDILCPNPESQTIKATSSSFNEERKTAEAQSPYLVYLLERVLPFAEQHRNSPPRHPSHAPQGPCPPPKSTRLSRPASATLQSTLLAAVFGPRTSADFQDGLAHPPTGDVDSDTRIGSRADAAGLGIAECMGDWFKGEVWRVLGWEILGGKIAWEA